MAIRKLRLRPDDMFSNVNEVVQQLYMAERSNYQFIIDWSNSCYYDPQREQDTWKCYFEDCFPDQSAADATLEPLPSGVPVACARNNIITPRLEDGNCVPLLLPRDRQIPHRIIQRYIVVKPHIQEIIENYTKEYFRGYVIGLHIRGPGGIDGGAPGMRSRHPCKNGVPFGLYFRFVDSQLAEHPGARIFACSDSSFVIAEIRQHYGDCVFTYPSTRSVFGEMHVAGHPANRGAKYPSYQLDEDVLVKAYIMSKVDCFVHGNSNFVNFVLCKNSTVAHTYVYQSA